MYCLNNPSYSSLVSIETIVQTILYTGIMTTTQEHQIQAFSSGWQLNTREQAALERLMNALLHHQIMTGCQRYLAVVA